MAPDCRFFFVLGGIYLRTQQLRYQPGSTDTTVSFVTGHNIARFSHGGFKSQVFWAAEFLLSHGKFNVHIRPDLVKDFSVSNVKHANRPIHSTGTNSLGKILASIKA